MEKSITALRMLGVQMVNKANSGHPGIVLDAAPMAYVLFSKHMNISNQNKTWINRDRFVLSAGHGSALLYALLHMCDMGYTLQNLKDFRQVCGPTPGHPEYDIKRGVECTTGPLGQGLGMAAGMAIAESYLAAQFNRADYNVIDHYTYAICGDGDLQEGISAETMSLAGRLKLKKLIVLFDSNDIQLDAEVEIAQADNLKKRCESNHWHYQKVHDGNDTKSIHKAIVTAQNDPRPSLIEIKTIIGEGATKEGTSKVHGAALGDDIENVKTYYHWNEPDFTIPNDVYEDFKIHTTDRGNQKYQKWLSMMTDYKKEWPELFQNLQNNIDGLFNPQDFDITTIATQNSEATRASSGKILKLLSAKHNNLLGGTADLSSSTKAITSSGKFLPDGDYKNSNIAFGVREFGMGAINNGLFLHGGVKSFASTFFVFTDYLKPALRLASLMGIGNLWILSHDSVLLGEDGPTHQPIEQLTMLRAQPCVNVFRPADFNETWGTYICAMTNNDIPSVIALSRQNLPQLKKSSALNVAKGGYTVHGLKQDNDIIITATGSEVHLAIEAATILHHEHNLKVKVISMPCLELFNNQPQHYQDALYESFKPFTVTLECGATLGWKKFGQLNIGIDRFGISGKGPEVLAALKLTPRDISNLISHHFVKNNR